MNIAAISVLLTVPLISAWALRQCPNAIRSFANFMGRAFYGPSAG